MIYKKFRSIWMRLGRNLPSFRVESNLRFLLSVTTFLLEQKADLDPLTPPRMAVGILPRTYPKETFIH
jgi:hypothetical protein